MKIAVIGAGIVGATTAYELASDGHEVTVFERRGAVAEEASFANAGLLSPGYLPPWTRPGMPRGFLAQMLAQNVLPHLGWPLGVREFIWLWRWLRAARAPAAQTRHARLHNLAVYSQERLHALTHWLKLEYEQATGSLVLLHSEKDNRLIQAELQALREIGLAIQEISAEAVRKLEPGLNPDTHFFGALHLPQAQAVNSRQFALLLKQQAKTLGAEFCFNTVIERLEGAASPRLWLAGQTSARTFDAVVLCAGLGAADLLRSAGARTRIALVALHGYSISAPVREVLNAPNHAIVDGRSQLSITRLGQRMRVAGITELGGSPQRKRTAALRTLYQALQDWFPGAAQYSVGVQEWKGARPALPDGLPLLGASGVPGVWLNFGHGTLGWALSCGSARILADLIQGRTPEINTEGLGLDRLG